MISREGDSPLGIGVLFICAGGQGTDIRPSCRIIAWSCRCLSSKLDELVPGVDGEACDPDSW